MLLSLAVGAACGVLYGLLTYLWLRDSNPAVGVMVASYLFLVPLGLGLISSLFVPRGLGVGPFIGYAAATVAVFLVVALVVGWEGLICISLAAPAMFVCAALGALIGYALRRWRGRTPALLLGAALPALLGPLEARTSAPQEYRTVSDSIVIHASAAQVWKQIRSVPLIRPAEVPRAWVYAIGLPRPREAVLAGSGVGAARTASFEGGLSFLETVTDWAPGERLAFRIEARDPGGLDPHVRVGGAFFDVVSGRYQIEAVGPGTVVLHLDSTQRLSTHFNAYTGFFTQAIMHSLQASILQVIRARAEGEGTARWPAPAPRTVRALDPVQALDSAP